MPIKVTRSSPQGVVRYEYKFAGFEDLAHWLITAKLANHGLKGLGAWLCPLAEHGALDISTARCHIEATSDRLGYAAKELAYNIGLIQGEYSRSRELALQFARELDRLASANVQVALRG